MDIYEILAALTKDWTEFGDSILKLTKYQIPETI